MKKMVMLLGILFLVVAFGSGCALFQKPPDNPDEKRAWIAKTESGLDTSELLEDALYTTFSFFCLDGSIDAKSCTTGDALHKGWVNSLASARGAVTKYKNGEITQAQAQLEVEKATLKALPEVLATLRKAKDVSNAKIMRMKRGDLSVPSGKVKSSQPK